MDLTVGFQFHLPYLMHDGQVTSILIATGPHVTVNTIVGLPFIQATHMIIDLSNNVADMHALDASPFPLNTVVQQCMSLLWMRLAQLQPI
jgi:hypothetical protein